MKKRESSYEIRKGMYMVYGLKNRDNNWRWLCKYNSKENEPYLIIFNLLILWPVIYIPKLLSSSLTGITPSSSQTISSLVITLISVKPT